jgi:hypothetical protein
VCVKKRPGCQHAVVCEVWVRGLPSGEDQLHWPGRRESGLKCWREMFVSEDFRISIFKEPQKWAFSFVILIYLWCGLILCGLSVSISIFKSEHKTCNSNPESNFCKNGKFKQMKKRIMEKFESAKPFQYQPSPITIRGPRYRFKVFCFDCLEFSSNVFLLKC